MKETGQWINAVADSLASFGERWLAGSGWRRGTVIGISAAGYLVFFVIARVMGGVHPFYLAVNFFLIVLASSALGLWGGLAAATVSSFIACPFLLLFTHPLYRATEILWAEQVLVLELFGFLAGSVSSVFRRLVRKQHDTRDLFVQAQKMESIGRLTGGIAHDFNNMLTAIAGYSHLLALRLQPTEENKKLSDELQDVVKRSASLTQQLLAVSRKGAMEPRPVAVEDGIRSLAKMLRRIIGENIELKLELMADSWEVNLDPVQLDQVLLNLAINASDAMPAGGTLGIRTEKLTVDRIFATQHPGLQLGDYLLICVTDTGAGIPSNLAPHVFEPYFTTKHDGKGTGLGLATVYGIVKQLGGDVWFHSQIGHGTGFKICLPAAHGDKRPRRTHRLPAGLSTAIGCKKVLVVEDDENVRSVVCELLSSEGYCVHAVQNGKDAIEVIEDPVQTFDVIIVDMVMPKVSGLTVVETVYRLRPNAGVIVTSGYSRDERANIEITALADKFLEKPFSGAQMLALVRELV